jgi:hypothetical protein
MFESFCFSDWLINRRHCGQQWQPAAAVIRQKIIRTVENLGDAAKVKQFSDPSSKSCYFNVYFNPVNHYKCQSYNILTEKKILCLKNTFISNSVSFDFYIGV